MKPLEQQVREALTGARDNARREHQASVGALVSDEQLAFILTALRPLLEQQAAAVATLTAERDEAREIAKRWHAHAADGRTGHGNYWPEERKKIAAWSGETR